MFLFCQRAVWVAAVLQGPRTYALSTLPAYNTTSSHVSFANNTGQTPLSSRTAPLPSFSTTEAGDGQTAAPTTAHGMGDFIAMGMGMADTSDLSSTDVATSSETSSYGDPPSHHSSQSSDSFASATTQQNTSSIAALPATSRPSGALQISGSANFSTTPSGYIPVGTKSPVWGNQSHTLTFSGDCWNQWNQYWSAEDLPAEESTYLSSRPGGTLTSFSIEGGYKSYITELTSYETTVFGARFPITTYTTLGPMTHLVYTSGPPTTTWFYTVTSRSVFFETTTRPTLSLQSPSCVLPGSVSQCQQSWDSYVSETPVIQGWEDGPSGCDRSATTEIPWTCQAAISSWDSADRSRIAVGDPPKCAQATIPEALCSSTRSQLLHNIERRGWQYYFYDEPKTLTTIDGTLTTEIIWPSDKTVGGYPGCTLGCGNCALQGETVELLFWPTSLANDTATAAHVGPWTLETLGTTLTSPTVYISFDKLWAKNSCSNIGGTFSNTIVPITKTEDMSSLYGFELSRSAQMSASFNFTDLYHDPTPDEIYESQPRCWASSMHAQGCRHCSMPANYTGCARTEPYEPIIKIPMEVRALDPAWAGCNGGIEGVYDPPIALTPTDAIAVPTKSESRTSTSNAAPASSPFPNPAAKTTRTDSPTPKPTGSAEPAVQDGAAGTSVGTHDQAPPQDPQKPTRSSGDNVWPLPPSNPDPESPETTNALSVLKSAQASAKAAQIAASIIADAAKHQSGKSGHDGDIAAHHTENSNDSVDPAALEAASPKQTSFVWTQESGIFTAVVVDGSAKIQGAGATTTLGTGSEAVFKGQTIRVSPEGGRIEVDGAALSSDPAEHVSATDAANEQGAMAFQASDHIVTAVPHDGSLVLLAAGATTTVAYGEKVIFAGNTISLPSSDESATNINVNGQWVTMNSLNRGNNALIPSSTVWTQGGETFTARMQSGSTIIVEAAGTTKHMAAGSTITLGDTVFSVPSPGGVLVHDGTSVTLDRATATDSSEAAASSDRSSSSTAVTVLDAGSSVIVEMGGRTFTLADGTKTTIDGQVVSAESTGGAIVVDGSATVGVLTRSSTAHSSGTSSTVGTEESTSTTTYAQSAGSVCRSPTAAATIIALFGFLLIVLQR